MAIPTKRHERNIVSYLDLGEIKALFSAAPGTDFTATVAGQPAAGNLTTFHPLVVTAVPYSRQPCVALFGDSITVGKGDPAVGNSANGPGGWMVRALSSDGSGRYAPKIPFLQMCISGESAANYVIGTKRRIRFQMASECSCTHAVIALGANDLTATVGSDATLRTNQLVLATMLAGRGMKCYTDTILPSTTSTDSWATTANQTKNANEPQRLTYNAWVRAGMPIDPTTKLRVAVGTSGALVTGQAGHPFAGWFETTDQVETARDSGLWKVDGTAFKWTVDGIHPSTLGHTSMAAIVSQAAFTV